MCFRQNRCLDARGIALADPVTYGRKSAKCESDSLSLEVEAIFVVGDQLFQSLIFKQNFIFESNTYSTNNFTKPRLKGWLKEFIHAYQLMVCLQVFGQTGPQLWVDCLAPPPVCLVKMGASR